MHFLFLCLFFLMGQMRRGDRGRDDGLNCGWTVEEMWRGREERRREMMEGESDSGCLEETMEKERGLSAKRREEGKRKEASKIKAGELAQTH